MKLVSLCLVILCVWPCSAGTVMDALSSRLDLITFTNFLRRAHLDSILNNGTHMVLAPTDAAFDLLPNSYISQLYDGRHPSTAHLLPDFLKYHIVPYTGQLDTNWTGQRVDTLLHKPLRIVKYDEVKKIVVNHIVMKDVNLSTSNGHIYILNTILSPPPKDIYQSLLGDSRFSTFLSAVTLAGMRNRLLEDNITVLAPTNDAFDVLGHNKTTKLFNDLEELQALVGLHILPGIYYVEGMASTQTIPVTNSYNQKLTLRVYSANSVRVDPGYVLVEQPDWLATNGVIHVLEKVLHPSRSCTNWLN